MQEWMIAMLVISIMLIIRDMAKTILAENLPDTEELPSLQEGHPQKERVEKYAASFQKLADTFYGMPFLKILCNRLIILYGTGTYACPVSADASDIFLVSTLHRTYQCLHSFHQFLTVG